MDLAQLLFILLMLAFFAAAVVVTLILCVVAFVLLMIGVTAISAIVGFRKGRVLSGLRALFVQLGLIAGMPVGALAALVVNEAWPSVSHHVVILGLGAAGGAVAGLTVALLADAALNMAAARLPRLRLPRTTFIPSAS
jgi:hypothetical protein